MSASTSFVRARLAFRWTLPAALLAATASFSVPIGRAAAEEFTLHAFERQQLTGTYYSEGANAGDIDGDGRMDVVHGPYWYAGPSFETAREIYPAVPQNVEGYADSFFSWVYDFNADGRGDVFAVGFPGTPAYVYENPGPEGFDRPWPKHEVIDSVANESPQLVDIVGDERPELVCTNAGFFGFAAIDWDRPFERWTFHRVSDQSAHERFGHGLGIGDVNGDGRQDILQAAGWYEQPEADAGDSRWPFHEVAFTPAYGGAEMYAYDVDGDGDNDVITCLAAHDFGLAWFEQVAGDGGEIAFRQHTIVGDQRAHSRYGVVFSEPHSVALADIDGDGFKDIVTGKTYYSHHQGSPMWDAGAVVYWFRLTHTNAGVDWVPYLADGEAGIGRQISVVDVDGDELLDIVVGGMKGAHVLRHRTESVDEATWKAAQPAVYDASEDEGAANELERGPPSPIDGESGRVVGALEGEALVVAAVSAGQAGTQAMGGFPADRWSGGEQLFWTGGGPGARLELELPVVAGSTYEVAAAFTMARDYAVIRVLLDDEPLVGPLGETLDLYHADVVTTGLISLGERELAPGTHKLTLEITGRNPAAVPQHMVGVDYVLLRGR